MFDLEIIKIVYNDLEAKTNLAREALNRPLTFTEKVLFNHMVSNKIHIFNEIVRGSSYINFNPDRVAMQDATAQMALLQFIMAGKSKVAVPTTVHCDHLIQAKVGAQEDLNNAWAMVTHNSTAGVDAAVYGVPVYNTDDKALSWEVANHSFNNINNPDMPDRTQWLNNLGYAMWSKEEIEQGLAWQHLKPRVLELIKNNKY